MKKNPCLYKINKRKLFHVVKYCPFGFWFSFLLLGLDYQPLFGKGSRVPPLLGEGRPDTRERRKLSQIFYSNSKKDMTSTQNEYPMKNNI